MSFELSEELGCIREGCAGGCELRNVVKTYSHINKKTFFFKLKHKFQKMVPPHTKVSYTFANVPELCFLHV